MYDNLLAMIEKMDILVDHFLKVSDQDSRDDIKYSLQSIVDKL